MAIISGRGGAPGSFIYEGAIASQGAGVASFNTVYMMVEAPDESSILTFPFNRPVAINSLNEYENLLGTLPNTGGAALTSYYAVKAFFQQAPVADLRVARVGTPSVIKEVSFNPAAKKDNGIAAPSNLQKGDLVYIKLTINSIELGERTRNGAWLGVPVEIPANYVAGDIDNNLAISNAMRDAVAAAIEANSDISAGAYIRELGQGDPSCDECSYIYLTGRVFNSPIEVVEGLTITGSQFILASSGYTIGNISESEKSVYDWIQAARTAFDDPKIPQGYMIAPAAFAEFNQADRVNLGQSMEEVCSDAFHKWLALIDCGPYYVTSIKDYKDFIEHNPAEGFEEDELSLIENVIYRWTDSNPLNFTSAKYDANSAAKSANVSLADGSRRALQDDRYVTVEAAVSTADNVLTLNADWPSNLLTGELIEVELFYNDPSPTAPTYNDAYTGVVNQDLVGTFYVIAADVDVTLNSDQIKLATSRTRAQANESVDVVTGGTPNGGALLTMRYASASWGFSVRIKGKESNVIEVNNGNGASVNTLHLPGSLQKPSAKHDFQAYVRQLTDASSSIGIGGNSINYYSESAISTADNTITIAEHGLNTRDKVYVQQLPSATRFTLEDIGPLTSVDVSNPTLNSDDYKNGTYENVPLQQGTGSGALATVVVADNKVTSITITEGGSNYKVGDEVRINKNEIGRGTNGANSVSNFKVLVDGIGGATGSFPTLYVIKVDDNNIMLAGSEASAEAGASVSIVDAGTNSETAKTPTGSAAQGVITTGGDAIVFSADHGLKSAERIYFDGAIQTANTTLFKATTSTASTLYYVNVIDRNFFSLTPSASNLAAEVFTNFPAEEITTNTPVRFYRRMASTLAGGTFSDSGLIRFIRGRKYQLDATLAVFKVKDEAGVGIEAGTLNPYGVAYTDDLSTDLRLSASQTPEGVAEYAFNAASVTNADNSITVTAHGYVTGQALVISEATGATLAAGLEEEKVYYAIVVDANTLKFAETAAEAVAGTAVELADDGTDNAADIQGIITLKSNPYTFTYTEDQFSNPLNSARDFAGENNFYCAPLSTGEQANSGLGQVFARVCLEDSTTVTTLFSSAEEIELVEPQSEVANSLGNFDAVTYGDAMAEALRGVKNNGITQSVVVDSGMEN